ncbi:MAG: tRNA pseudouridine(38-40) synthase TruA [Acidobacteriota bacterium]
MRYRLLLSYRGNAYYGWQRQPSGPTVQGAVEGALADLLGEPVTVHGASRTDTGVHARGQAAHLDLPAPFPRRGMVHGTNRRLPPDIRVLAADRMRPDFHALRSAGGKEYVYRLWRHPVIPPLEAPFMVPVHEAIDRRALQRAAAALVGRHDFTAFALAGGSHRHPSRHIRSAEWEEDGREIRFRVRGDGFLRGMVRSLVGTMIDIGLRRRTTADFRRLLTGRPRGEAGPTAPARGLCLERVLYPPEWGPVNRGEERGDVVV